jgi:hypothetical protein
MSAWLPLFTGHRSPVNKMADDKKYPDNDKRQIYHHDHPEGCIHRLGSLKVKVINEWRSRQTNESNKNAACKLPVPCHNKECHKDKGRQEVHKQ